MSTTTDERTPDSGPEEEARPEDERLPFLSSLGYGVQHLVAMFGGVIAVPLIVGGAVGLSGAEKGLLVSSALFVSGLATVLQTLGVPLFGAQLPLVQGISFASVSTMLTIISSSGAARPGSSTCSARSSRPA
jgi:xanthine/uracil permease